MKKNGIIAGSLLLGFALLMMWLPFLPESNPAFAMIGGAGIGVILWG